MAIIVQDSFNRADSTTGLGVADSGQTWEGLLGNYGIDTNRAYKVTTGTGLTVVESGVSDITMSADAYYPTVLGVDGGFVFRLVDSGNFFMLRWRTFNSVLQLYKFVNGSATVLSEKNMSISSGSTVVYKIITEGSSIDCYVNDILEFSITDSFNQNATKHGFRQYENNITYFDNLLIESLETTDPPLVTISNINKLKVSDEIGHNISTVTFQFDQDVEEFRLNTLGTSYDTGTTIIQDINPVPATTAIDVDISYTNLYQEGDNRINIYGKNASGLWTPYEQ